MIRSRLKQALMTGRKSGNGLVRHSVGVLDVMIMLVRAAISREHRSVLLLRWLKPGQVHQTTPLTWMDRYPQIFAACRDLVGGDSEVRVLSFGCSTGEEVLTLREYFPSAYITGADINPRNLAFCRKLKVDDRISFVRPDHSTLEKHGPFDLIFCMAVLQRTPQLVRERGLTDLKRIYPFEKFDRQVCELDALLKPGGLLVIDNAQYLFADSSVASRYRFAEGLTSGNNEPRFDRHSLLLNDAGPVNTVFRKLADAPKAGS
jgi:SAM-dependent methyltransferase